MREAGIKSRARRRVQALISGMRCGPAIAILWVACTAIAPALAEQPATTSGVWQRLPGPPAADSGKPRLPAPDAPGDRATTACLPALPCGTQLLGAVRKNGAVELAVPAFRW